jgi:hypothetical protein
MRRIEVRILLVALYSVVVMAIIGILAVGYGIFMHRFLGVPL